MSFGKQIFRTGIQKLLEALVRIKLQRTKPIIIGITGSIGKTSTKEAVYEVLKTKWRVYRNPKSLNTEIGLLLAILGQESGFRSPVKWVQILARACKNAFSQEQYDFLILEYGADKPGDIEHLVSIVKPNIAIITHIAKVHQANGQFRNLGEVFEEKKKLVTCLGKSDIAILNGADELLKKLDKKLTAKTLFFSDKNGMYADNLENTSSGFRAAIHMANQSLAANFQIPGTYHINILLPALLVGLLNGIILKEGIKALEHFNLPPGRMTIISGKYSSTLLDSSYNASPETMKQALGLLENFPGKRKIAVLGNMNELGVYSEKAHRIIAHHLGDWLDMLITVGELAHFIAEEALKKGFPQDKIKTLLTAEEAGNFLLEDNLRKGDVILFKGSQNRVRLERAVKMLMAHPEDAKKLLCRQEPQWKKIE